jgi:hypothetical protein
MAECEGFKLITEDLGLSDIKCQVLSARKLYTSDMGVTVGDRTFGPHEDWAFVIRSEERDRLVPAVRRLIDALGGYVSSHGYDPDQPIAYFSVVMPCRESDIFR